MNNYVFPFQYIEKGAKIILYGAGNVGQCFYKQLITTGYAKLLLWVDANETEYRKMGMPVEGVGAISEKTEVDYVVIAIENIKIIEEVRALLKNEYDIKDNQIVFSSNYRFAENGLYLDSKQEQTFGIERELKKVAPKKFLCSNRLDLAVRYLLAKDIINDVENRENLSLYSRMILSRTGGLEQKGYFSETQRKSTQEYIEAAKKLCKSMQKKGFDIDYHIPVGDNEVFLNGAHRIATALALEEDIWMRNYPGKKGNENFGMNWFDENGFNTEDKIRILRAYADLYETCGIMILFAPCMEQWEYITKQLEKHMTIVGSVTLDFSDNYIAFENLFREIYSDPLWKNVYIDRKVELLKLSALKIRLLLVSDEGFETDNFYETIAEAKLELRDRMFFNTDIAPVVMHGSNNADEFLLLKRILLSVNNMRHLRMRYLRTYSDEFVERLEELKRLLRVKGIRLGDICIAGGSSWEIFGLRKTADIDFSVKRKYRQQYGDGLQIWGQSLEYVRINSIKISEDAVYDDDLLIEDDNFHYMFNGLKFVNLDIIARKKAFDRREKDLRDIRSYELFMDYASNFNDKALLKRQIEKEFYGKRQ